MISPEMATKAASSDLEDPLRGYSYLSLFPRTCRSLGVVAKPTELSDLESVHNVLKNVAMKETGGLIEQAKRILEGSSEDMQSEVDVNAAVLKDFRDIGVVDDEIARKRRPGHVRNQAKFNFNHRLSRPVVIKEPTLDIAKLEDPEKFFLAHERLENAKKELRKQGGVLADMNISLNDLSLTARHRRLRNPGRSKATYKHHCSSVVSNNDGLKESTVENAEKVLMSSSFSLPPESLLQQNHRGPTNEKMQQEPTDPIEDRVLGGSISEVNEFLDKILSGTYDHLSSDGQLTLLQEQLQIKPISIDNLSLPKLPDIPKYDFTISGNFSKPRKSLHDIQAAFTEMSTITPVNTMRTPGSVHLSASPTPPKSPFANLSSLKKHIMQLNRSKDSFSDFNTDPYSVGGSSPVNCADKQPDSVDIQGDSRSKFKVYAYDEDEFGVSTKPSHHEALQDLRDFPDMVDDNSTVVAGFSGVLLNKSGCALVGAPVEPLSRAENYNCSPTNDLSDSQMQSENANQAQNSSEPHSCMVDQHSSPAAASYGKQSAFPNLGSEHLEDIPLEDVIDTSMNKKTKRKTVPVHRTTNMHPQRNDIAVAGTDAQEQEPSGTEVQAEYVSMEMNSTQPASSIDICLSPGAELLEKYSDLPDIGPALERVKDVTDRSINNKRKGKSSPLQEHDESVEVRKKQKKKGDGIGALAKESCGEFVRICRFSSVNDQCHATGAKLHDNQSEIPNNYPVQHEELVVGSIPKTSLNKQSKTKDLPSQELMEHAEEVIRHGKKLKRKELSLRKSIAVAGTSFESGVRRSTRLRMRPLEFWRGERFLYGRLEPDSTLPTLIGVKKYATPAKQEGKAILQVLDCVDGGKYRELIDLAALH